MRNFIEDFLSDPSKAVSDARLDLCSKPWYGQFDDDEIYKEMASPEFRLYEEITTAPLSASPSLSPISASA